MAYASYWLGRRVSSVRSVLLECVGRMKVVPISLLYFKMNACTCAKMKKTVIHNMLQGQCIASQNSIIASIVCVCVCAPW